MQFQIDNMTCGGCARGVTKAIQSVDPQAKVSVDLATRRVDVETGSDEAAVAAVLDAAGFTSRRLI